MLKHYVEFMFPGSFYPETQTVEIANRDQCISAPEGCFGYRIFSRTEVSLDGEVLTGKDKDFSGTTYFGKAMTLEEIKELGGDNAILVSNMECNKWDRVVRTIRGNFRPLFEVDRVIEHA